MCSLNLYMYSAGYVLKLSKCLLLPYSYVYLGMCVYVYDVILRFLF